MTGFVPVVKRWWWLLLLAALVAGIMGNVVASRITPTYEAETRLLVGPINSDSDTLRAASSLAQTYAALATSRPLLDAAGRAVGVTIPVDTLAKRTSASASDITRILTVHVRDQDPARAAALANALADQLVELPARDLSRPEGALSVVDRATLPTDSIDPSPSLIAPLAGLAGLLGALGLALLADALSSTVRTRDDVTDAADVPFLGAVDGAQSRGGRIVIERKPDSRAAAAYRLLAAKVGYGNGSGRPRSLLVLPPGDDEAAWPLAANLAAALGEGGADVALVDVGGARDLERFLHIPETIEQGRARALDPLEAGGIAIDRVRWTPRMTIVPALSGQPADDEQATAVLERILEHADVAVLVAGRLDRAPTGLLWAKAVDATMLLVQRDRTRRESMTAAAESLDLVGAHVIGAVLGGERI